MNAINKMEFEKAVLNLLHDPLLTVTDLERLLCVNRRTIARLCKRGQLPTPMKLGGLNRWRPEDIAQAINALASKVRFQDLNAVGVED